MNYKDVENELSIKIVDKEYDFYFKMITSLVEQSTSFSQFMQPVILLINLENKYKLYLDKALEENYNNLWTVLQNRFVILGENISPEYKPSRDMFFLFKTVTELENLPKNTVILSNIEELTQEYEKNSFEGPTQLFIHDILFILEILNGEKKALKNYLKRTFTLHIHNIEKNYTEFVKKILLYFNVKLDLIIEVYKELLEEQYYFNLLHWQRRSLYNWILHVLSQLQFFHNNSLWYTLYESLLKLLYTHIEKDHIDEVMYLNFFILHMMANLFQKQEEFNDFNIKVNKPVSEYLQKWSKKNTLIKCKKGISQNNKIKIAFVETRLIQNSPYAVLVSTLKPLLRTKTFTDKYELTIYTANYFEKSEDDLKCMEELENLGINVINPNTYIKKKAGLYHSHFEKALNLRNEIIKNDTDILITYNDYDIFNFLFTTRTTPKQIYWSHGNFQYEINGIDLKISHILNSPTDYNIFSSVYDLKKYNPPVNQNEVEIIKRKYNGKIILGYIGRLIKIDNQEYLDLVCKLLDKYPDTIFLACGGGNKNTILEKIEKYNVSDRFIFTGHIDPNVYGHVINIYLTSFMNGGEALAEYANKGMYKFYINMEKCTQKERENYIKNKISSHLNLLEKVCNTHNISVEEYTIQALNFISKFLAFNDVHDYQQKAQFLIENYDNQNIAEKLVKFDKITVTWDQFINQNSFNDFWINLDKEIK